MYTKWLGHRGLLNDPRVERQFSPPADEMPFAQYHSDLAGAHGQQLA